MDTQLVRTAASKLGVSSERVFKLAYEWSEIRHSKDYIMIQFLNWFHHDKINKPVEDFILDVLSGRIKSNEIPK